MAPLLVVGGLLAALVATGLAALTADDSYLALGLPDPGALTRYGFPAVRVITEVSAAVAIGSLLFATFLTPQQRSGTLAADGYAALRTAGWASMLWSAGALLLVPFTMSDSAGQSFGRVLRPDVFITNLSLEQAKAWLITAVLALVLAVCCRLTLRWNPTAALFFLALSCLLPQAFTGHSASGGAHDLATNSLLFHLFAAVLWVGGLVALLAHARRGGGHLGLAARRFSKLALVCWLVMAVSGVINALVRLPLSDLFSTNYGLLVLAKVTALVILGVFGWQQRARGVRRVLAQDSPKALMKLAGVEVMIMFITFGIAAALSRTAPPADAAGKPDTVEVLVGYDLDGPPSLLRMLFDWRFDLFYGTAAILLAVLYLLGVRRLRRRGDNWPVGRTAAWLGGCLLVLVATSSGIGRYAPAMFSVHMGSHMLLNMMAPVLLVLGGPVTLALRALPAAGKDAPPGPREWLLAFVHSPVTRVLTHPVVALALFVGSFYGLYFSGLFDAALSEHWAHLVMNAHFILIGYIFYWPVIGIDPAPRRLPHLGRLGMLLVSLPFHAFFGVILMNSQTIIGHDFYTSLGLPWVSNLLADQNLGGGIAWAFGEFPLVVVLIALLAQWSRDDERTAKRHDRKADADGEADLAAYNAMLAKLAESDTRSRQR
jgi:putative copper resistance protein D